MRRLFAFFLLSLLPLAAVAAPVCIPGFYGTTLDVAAPKRDDLGWRIVWVCRDDGGQPKAEWLVCLHGVCNRYTLADTLDAAVRSADPVAAIKQAWGASVTGGSYMTATGNLKTLHERAAADGGALIAAYNARASAPVEVRWAVAVNSSYTTRPTYAWVNGERSTTPAAERVAVGAPCDPQVGVVTTSGVGSYLGVLGRPDRVALCRKQ